MAEEKKTQDTTGSPDNEQGKVAKIYAAARSLPNGSVVKVEQSASYNVRLTLSKGEEQQSVVVSPQVARTLAAMLGGCLQSQP